MNAQNTGDERPREPDAPREEEPRDHKEERGICWVCGARVNERYCKIICPRCGFMRDCSDP